MLEDGHLTYYEDLEEAIAHHHQLIGSDEEDRPALEIMLFDYVWSTANSVN